MRVSRLAGVAAAGAVAGVNVMGMSAPAGPVSPIAMESGMRVAGVGPSSVCRRCIRLPVGDDGTPGDNAAEGGVPAPAMVPNIDGSPSPPGTPGAI